MSEPSQTHDAAQARPRWWLRALAVVFIASAAFAGSAAVTCGWRVFKAVEPKPASTTTTTLRATSSVVSAVRDLSVLSTAAYHMERVIDLRDHQSHLYGMVQGEDALLLVAAADVVAGVDLSTLREGDVSCDAARHVARVMLPPATILSARLDNDRTYVHSRKTDVFARRAETLETRARQEAEHTLRDAAVQAGILGRAQDSAARTVRTLLQGLGFERVEVGFRPE